MRHFRSLLLLSGWSIVAFSLSALPALAASGPDLSKVENFAQNVIQALVTLAGLLAAGFFVVGGYHYITSSGNPEGLDRAKKTIVFSAIGLAISIAALVISGIVGQLASTAFGS